MSGHWQCFAIKEGDALEYLHQDRLFLAFPITSMMTSRKHQNPRLALVDGLDATVQNRWKDGATDVFIFLRGSDPSKIITVADAVTVTEKPGEDVAVLNYGLIAVYSDTRVLTTTDAETWVPANSKPVREDTTQPDAEPQ